MKTAPLVAGSALGLLLLVLATAHPKESLLKVVPLDFTGIDTLEVRGDSPNITVSSRGPAVAGFEDDSGGTLVVRRQANRLVITAHVGEYVVVSVRVPPRVRAIDVEGAEITAKEPLQFLTVTSSDGATLAGDIARLELRDTSDPSRHVNDGCDCVSFTVSNGRIHELVVRSPHATLRLSDPDTIDAVHAWLGEKGDVQLTKARRLDNIHLVPAEALLPDAVGPEPSPTQR